jgi:hypothetical protein
MKRTFVLTVMLMAVAALALGVPDPWRIKVSDLDPNGPVSNGFIGASVRENFGTNGGTIRQYYWNAEVTLADNTKTDKVSINSFNASTGAISFGTLTGVTIDTANPPFEGLGLKNVIKVGSIYKAWKWIDGYTGQCIRYTTSGDGANFAIPTRTTIYGSCSISTGVYGFSAMIKNTPGDLYVGLHNCDNKGAKGVMTSGVGETIWWDIDTGHEGDTYGWRGDPLDQDGYHFTIRQENQAAVGCTGDLFSLQNGFPDESPWMGEGLGMIISTAGFGAGGDHYIWLADTDNNNTRGIGDSLLSGIGFDGLSGPSLRCSGPGAWMSWNGSALGLVDGDHATPANKFVLLYAASWDTNSDATKDLDGEGRAYLWLTRNKADLNFDGTVNFSDIAPFSTAYGSTSGVSANYNPDADFNSDGKVDFSDISPLSTRYGSDCSFQ